ncbi:MAG: hypothetical protein IT159_08370 [Bryobacterales bacterium]|nr:hypothetical protein [Bryobacterales bacterium]
MGKTYWDFLSAAVLDKLPAITQNRYLMAGVRSFFKWGPKESASKPGKIREAYRNRLRAVLTEPEPAGPDHCAEAVMTPADPVPPQITVAVKRPSLLLAAMGMQPAAPGRLCPAEDPVSSTRSTPREMGPGVPLSQAARRCWARVIARDGSES